jgi:hypothetical protein
MAPSKHARTAQVEGEIVIGRPVEEVFEPAAIEPFNQCEHAQAWMRRPAGVSARC